MRKFNKYTVAALAILISACAKVEDPSLVQPSNGSRESGTTDLSEISGSCIVDTRRTAIGATKTMDEWALIDQLTTRELDANFLRIDEEYQPGLERLGAYTFFEGTPFGVANQDGEFANAGAVNWEKAFLCEATVISSPDNTDGIHYRSILFKPRQAYNILTEVDPHDSSKNDTTRFYHTRMVGWYPQNCELLSKNPDGTYQQFESSEQKEVHKIDGRTYKAIKFTGLDGSKDIMVSNVCEAQHWHSSDPAKSPGQANSGVYRRPFGHYQKYNVGANEFEASYSNYFKFRHYLTGVRFWGFVPEQNSHSLDMWGNITDVVLLNQPTSVCVTLPEEPKYEGAPGYNSVDWNNEDYSNAAEWGQAYGWGDFQNFSVQTGKMFGDDTNHSSEAYTVDFSKIDMTGVGDMKSALYLGYSLVQPNNNVEVEIHTRYGVYVTQIAPTYTYKDSKGVSHTADIFKPGYYYDVYLSLQTDGTIAALIENRGEEKYYDLTRHIAVDVDGSPTGSVSSYRYSNCYIVDPALDEYNTDSIAGCDYDGFFFSAMVPGNGSAGIINKNSQTFYPSKASLAPTSARLIWESSRLLVSEVELINGYVKFKVPGANQTANFSAGKYTGTKGNAVIGVFDDNDKCLWSWHIWVTDTPQDIEYNTISIMDRNLGATYGGTPTSSTQALQSYGLYYQWGRKDPSMGPESYNYSLQDGGTAPYYDYSSDEHTSSLPMSFYYPTIQNSVENPMYLILPVRKSNKGYVYDWLYFEPENMLWGYNTATGSTTKTIYDPCPFGYRVPSGEVSTILTNGTVSSTKTYGITVSGTASNEIFFPFAGYKGVDKGISSLGTEWRYVGAKGDYQENTYTLDSDDGMYHRKRMYISKATSWLERRAMGEENYTYGTNISAVNASCIFADYTNRRTAASVRCVKDVDFGNIRLKNILSAESFVAGDKITVKLDASSSASQLTNVSFTITHIHSGETVVATPFSGDPSSASWHFEYVWTAPELDYILETNGIYVFRLEATNAYGVTEVLEKTVSYGNAGELVLKANSATIGVAGTHTIEVTTNTSGGALSYTSSNEAVATVAADGTITGVAVGTATITVRSAANNGYTEAIATFQVTVKTLEATSIDMVSSMTIEWSDSHNLEATATSGGAITYSSSNTSVATVDASGEVTAVGIGTATITATTAASTFYTEASSTCAVTVTKKNQTLHFGFSSTTIRYKETATHAVGGALTAVTYTSSDETVATVDANGKITTVKPGTTRITANAAASATCNAASTYYDLTVQRATRTISINPVTLEIYGDAETVSPGSATISIASDDGEGGTYTYGTSVANTVATVAEGTGVVTAGSTYGKGTVIATVSQTEYYEEATASADLKVYAYVYESTTHSGGGEYAIGDATSGTTHLLGVDLSTTTTYAISNQMISAKVPKTSSLTLTGTSTLTIKNSDGKYLRNSNSSLLWDTRSTSWTYTYNNAYNVCYNNRYLRYANGQWYLRNSNTNVYYFKRRCE